MRKVMLWLLGSVMLLGGALQAQERDISGNWQGTLEAGKGLRTVLKISKAESGGWKAVLYSVDQGGQPIPVTSIVLQGQNLIFAIKPLDVTYTGTLNLDGTTISGNATQNGQTHALNLEHVSEENTFAIPKPPVPMPANAHPKFDVVTIKPSDPNRPGKLFTVHGRHILTINTNMNDLVTFAYGLHPKEIVNTPDWFGTEKFDLDGVPDIEGQPSSQQLKELIQSALTDRFKLTFHHDQRELSVYALTVAKGGPKMTVTSAEPSAPRNFLFGGLGKLRVSNMTMKDFCDGMQGAVMDKPVVDQTGLTARYDFNLNWTPDQSQFAAMGVKIPAANPDDPNAPPSLYTAMQEQLGLKLEATKAKADVIVIDHVEKPSAN